MQKEMYETFIFNNYFKGYDLIVFLIQQLSIWAELNKGGWFFFVFLLGELSSAHRK